MDRGVVVMKIIGYACLITVYMGIFYIMWGASTI